MIDPSDITNFNRSEIELQEYLLFCACVAGKTSPVQAKNLVVQAKKLEDFLYPSTLLGKTPFEYINHLEASGKLMPRLRYTKLGQYNRLHELFKKIIALDVENVDIDELENVPGIGPKTSRFFLLHSRPNQRVAVLDTHILSWLRENTKGISISTSTPQTKSRYNTIEKLFISEADKRNIGIAEFDLHIWNERSRN
jgi:thermostable 8-oxoguanine DNA glycosylase